jgi:peptide/nickel transport system ATP-binding protein
MLELRDVRIAYRRDGQSIQAVDGVTLTVNEGDALGIVGESGCGKTTLARLILRILPRNARVLSGSVVFRGRDLLAVSDEDMRQVRWRRIAMIPQSAMNSLDPVYRVGDQIIEAIVTHERVSRRSALDRVEDTLRLVGIDPRRARDFPHQFSGGMRQRVAIAMAMALRPEIIIADEPTTALDVITQNRVVRQLLALRRQFGVALIYISHDLPLVSEVCDRLAVMYGGRVVEEGTTLDLFEHTFHPYAMGLLNAAPRLDERREIVTIPGAPLDLTAPISGCRFRPRCPFAEGVCADEDPPLAHVAANHVAACHFASRADAFRTLARQEQTWTRAAPEEPRP